SAIERSVVVADIAFTSCASSLRRTMHGWSACYVLRDFWLSMRTAVKNIVVSPAAGLAAHGDVLIPRVRSAPSARLRSHSYCSSSQDSRNRSANEVQDESCRDHPQQPVDIAAASAHDMDEGPGDESDADAVGDGIGQRHRHHGEEDRQRGAEIAHVDLFDLRDHHRADDDEG